jgi:diphosphomevalonate decarboxylase
MTKIWKKSAHSNIALIKYMGKLPIGKNVATNPSLSYTLPHLTTTVTLQQSEQDTFLPLPYKDIPLHLSDKAMQRFVSHLDFIKKTYDFDGHFHITSSNNFPHSSGLASSASSFAALTQCAIEAIFDIKNEPYPPILEQARLSSKGSGSSCRSFFSPWAIWDNQLISSVDMPYPTLIHQVIMIEDKPKTISSSQAHEAVLSSPTFNGRIERAKARLISLTQALQSQNWADAIDITFEECMDMHTLFHTAIPPFEYMNAAAKEALALLTTYRKKYNDAPLITMDAGPNIHLLYHPNQPDTQTLLTQMLIDKGYHVNTF